MGCSSQVNWCSKSMTYFLACTGTASSPPSQQRTILKDGKQKWFQSSSTCISKRWKLDSQKHQHRKLFWWLGSPFHCLGIMILIGVNAISEGIMASLVPWALGIAHIHLQLFSKKIYFLWPSMKANTKYVSYFINSFSFLIAIFPKYCAKEYSRRCIET